MKRIILIFALIILSFSNSQAQDLKQIYDSTNYYMNIYDYQSAIKISEHALNEFSLVEKDTNYANLITKLAEAYNYIGQYDRAIEYARKDSALRKKLQGENHSDYISALNNLGYIYQSAGMIELSGSLYIKALELCEKVLGKENNDYAACLDNLGSHFCYTGKFLQAEPLLIEALEIRKKIIKTDHEDIATSLNNVGYLFNETGDYGKAEKYYLEALEMLKRLHQEDDNGLAGVINNIGAFYDDISQYGKAEVYYIESLEMRKRLYGYDCYELILSNSNLGSLYEKTGRYDKAVIYLQKALDMSRRLYKTGHPQLASSINNMAVYYSAIGNFKESEKYYLEALDIQRTLYENTDNLDLALSINNMAYFYFNIGRYTEAEKLFLEVYDMYKRILQGMEHPVLAYVSNNLALLYETKSKYTLAEPYYLKSIEIYRHFYAGDNVNTALALTNTGSFYFNLGRYDDAEKLLTEGMEMRKRIFKGDNIFIAQSLNNMAVLYETTKKSDSAEAYYKAAIDMYRRLFKDGHKDLGNLIDNLGVYYSQRHKFEKAGQCYKEALAMNEKLLEKDHPGLAKMYFNLAGHYKDIGKYEASDSLYKKAINIYKKHYGKNHLMHCRLYMNHGILYFLNNNYSAASQKFRQGLDILLHIMNENLSAFSENEMLQYVHTFNSNFDVFNSFVLKSENQIPRLTEDMYNYTISTKAALLSSVQKVKSLILNSGDSSLVAAYNKWIDMKEHLVKLYKLSDQELSEMHLDLETYKNEVNRLEKDLTKKSKAFAREYDKKDYTWKDIKKQLKDNEAAVEIIKFYLFDKFFRDTVVYAALIIDKDTEKHPKLILIDSSSTLESYYEKYRKAVSKSSSNKDSEKLLKELYAVFWTKIDSELKGANTIYLSVEGVYNKINLNMLINPKSGKYILEEMDIKVLTSTRELAEFPEINDKRSGMINKKAILIGDPQYNLDSIQYAKIATRYHSEEERALTADYIERNGINRLPGTRKEIEIISKEMAARDWQVSQYTGAGAVEETIKAVDNPTVLHIATHGLFLKDIDRKESYLGIGRKILHENPLLRSMLLLAGADNSLAHEGHSGLIVDDGQLTAYEAMNMRLDSTELVVLSACETGLGTIVNSQGVYGLQRAFIVAGADNIIMSLWSVDDNATQQLMAGFYKNWLSGMSKREAFREAQLNIKKKYKHPYYWGAFIMIGR